MAGHGRASDGAPCTFETAPWRGWSLAETLWEENLGRGGLALRAELRARDWFWSARVWLSGRIACLHPSAKSVDKPLF